MAENALAEKMTMTVGDAGACEKKIEFSVARDVLAKEADRTVSELAQMVVIPGFRRGKAPAGMIRKRYAEELKGELKRKIFQAAFERLGNEKFDIVTYDRPEEAKDLSFDEDFAFTLSVGVAPEFEMPAYTGIEVSVPAVEVGDKEVEERLNYYREMYAAYADADTPAEPGDMLKVSYTSDFELPADASQALRRAVESDSNYLWLAEPESIPGSIRALTGAEAGKEYELKAVYPEDFHQKELAGKTVNFKVKVEGVQRRKLLDDAELCAKLQVGSIDEIKTRLSEVAKHEAEDARKGQVREAVYAKLDAAVPAFELPAKLVESETANELRQTANRTVKTEEDAEAFKEKLEEHRSEAEKAARAKLRRQFIFRKIAEAEEIKVGQDEVDNQIALLSRYYGRKEKEMRQLLESNGGADDIAGDMLNAKVWDFIADKAAVQG